MSQDPLLECGKCKARVHESCYVVNDDADREEIKRRIKDKGEWLCDPCSKASSPLHVDF